MIIASAISLTACGMIDGLTITETGLTDFETVGGDSRVDTFDDGTESSSSGGDGESSTSGAAPECFEVSGSFGPCTTDAECASGLTCIISDDAASGYCAAACEADGCEQDCFPTWQTKCTEDKVCTWPCKVNADCGPGMVCATEDGAGACMWPCLGTGQCWDGTACVDECA